jgi:hypothetical protein
VNEIFAAIYRYWVAIMAVAVVVQIGFAGVGAFGALDRAKAGGVDEDGFFEAFTAHAILGTLIVPAGLLLVIFALLGRVGRTRTIWSAGLFGLLVLQLLLGWTGAEVPWVLGLLHPVNALVILAVLGVLAHGVWRGRRAADVTGV